MSTHFQTHLQFFNQKTLLLLFSINYAITFTKTFFCFSFFPALCYIFFSKGLFIKGICNYTNTEYVNIPVNILLVLATISRLKYSPETQDID